MARVVFDSLEDMTAPAIEVESLVVAYDSHIAVDRLSFTADRGQVLALLGPNGAGKTTTVESLEGYRRPTAGTLRVLGLAPIADRRLLAERIGVMLQAGGAYPVLSARRVLRLFASYYSSPREPDELIDLLGLSDVARTPARRLSGGERQRLSLALALIGRPEVAFLDEPTAGVDPAGRIAIRKVIADLAREGVCVLLTTHELDEAERLADQIVIIDHGELLAAGTPEQLTAGREELSFTTASSVDREALAALLGAAVEEEAEGRYRVGVRPSPTVVATVTAYLAEHDIGLIDLQGSRQRLEDVFLRLTASPQGTGPLLDRGESTEAGRGRRGRGRRRDPGGREGPGPSRGQEPAARKDPLRDPGDSQARGAFPDNSGSPR